MNLDEFLDSASPLDDVYEISIKCDEICVKQRSLAETRPDVICCDKDSACRTVISLISWNVSIMKSANMRKCWGVTVFGTVDEATKAAYDIVGNRRAVLLLIGFSLDSEGKSL